ncbi:MAG: hypothetical protein GX254_09345 [Clostridiales bacterium]|jgi:hypothetical protein|nr:hypothetical protein [Clostridiales bacterium]
MKTVFKALIGTAAAILAGVFFMYAYSMYTGQDIQTYVESKYQDLMLEAKSMFLEKPDQIQLATLGLLDHTDTSILRGRNGEPFLRSEDGPVPVNAHFDEETEAYINDIMGEFSNNGIICNIKATPEAVVFFTSYDPYGCVGFLYEKELGNTKGYITIEIVENWKLFHKTNIA